MTSAIKRWTPPPQWHFFHPFLSDPSPIIGYACHSLTNSLTNSLLFSKLDWCIPGVWRFQLKTYWCCNCCWRGSCWQQFVADFEAEVYSKSLTFVQTLSTRSCQDFEVEVQARFEARVWSISFCWCFVEVMKLNLGRDSEARLGQDFEA